MKRQYIITLETKTKNDFGIKFMESILFMIIMKLNQYRKSYFAKIEDIKNN